MVYGFISSLDDETTKVFFRSKKIRCRGQEQSAGTDLYFQTINQYYLWNAKKRYGVPNASSGKCWRKYVEQMANI